MIVAEEFIQKKLPAWRRLEELLKRTQRGLYTLSAEDLQDLGRLYRQATSDLAIVQRDYPHDEVCTYVASLVARAHGQLYRGKGTHLNQIGSFFTQTFPRLFRKTWGHTLAAFLMFAIPALVSAFIAYRDPTSIELVMPGFQEIAHDIEQGHEWWKSINDTGRAASSSFIMTNNIRVTFLAFAGGITLGVFSLYVLAQNGILFGSVVGAAYRHDFADNLWGFVAPHGVVELSVIFIAGGAGLQLGWSILRPYLLTRRAALKVASVRAVQLLFGCAVLLVIAGLIEGFLSPSNLPLFLKIGFSLSSGFLLYGYLLFAGEEQKNDLHHRPGAPAGRSLLRLLRQQ